MQFNFATKRIDHSCGRIEILNGDVFYSPNPNGSWVVLSEYQDPQSHIFSLHKGIQWHDFLHPHWHASRTIFLTLLTLNPIITGYPFDRLVHIPTQDCLDDQYTLKKEGQESWSRLERNLILATMYIHNALKSKLFIDHPFASWAFSYSHPSPTHQIMKKRAALSQDWFQIWIALLSYFIACTGIHDSDTIPPWYTLLQSEGLDEWFINGIRSSDAVNFSHDVSRVGVPHLAWFIQFNVPVWYHLSTSLISGTPNNPLANLVPPSELVTARLEPWLLMSPLLPIQGSSTNQSKPYISWQDFFMQRAALNEQILQRKSVQDCEVQLNQECQLSTRRTKVFKWTHDDNPNDDCLYC